MDRLVWIVFAVVYVAMIFGRLPGLALDRTGVAMLGAIALIGTGRVPIDELPMAIHVPTLVLLFGLMIVSAQFRLGGFYTRVVSRLTDLQTGPKTLLAALIGAAGALSAVLANDIVCLAATPVLVEACARRRLNPTPFLLALACASNVGSASTLIGNPQNMLIGQVLRLSFGHYFLFCFVPVLLGLAATWGIIVGLFAGRWAGSLNVPPLRTPPYDRWQSLKGMAVLAVVMIIFLWGVWPNEIVALSAAGLLLCSRRMHSRDMLGLVDWHLLVLFFSLFVVNHAMRSSGNLDRLFAALTAVGADARHPGWLFGLSVILSNLVSNVPATMLLLPSVEGFTGGAILALSSTLAGNLFLVGSLANLIVVDQAATLGFRLGWREHARVGVPVTLATLAMAALWLYVMR